MLWAPHPVGGAAKSRGGREKGVQLLEDRLEAVGGPGLAGPPVAFMLIETFFFLV